MDKLKALKIINAGFGISFFIQILSGMAIGNFGTYLPNFLFATHAACGWIVLFFALLHIAYNWNWVKNNFLSYFS